MYFQLFGSRAWRRKILVSESVASCGLYERFEARWEPLNSPDHIVALHYWIEDDFIEMVINMWLIEGDPRLKR